MAPPLNPNDPVIPITQSDLPSLDARQVNLNNADLALFSRRVFSVAGVPVRFQRTAPAHDQTTGSGSAAGVWLWLSWAGQPLLLQASPAFADAVTQSLVQLGVDELGDSGIDLFAQLMLAPQLPAGLSLRRAALTRDGLEGPPSALDPLGIWEARHLETGERSGHQLCLWAGPECPVTALLATFASLASTQLESPLSALPIALPLVAARWSVDVQQLRDLAVGDVLLLG